MLIYRLFYFIPYLIQLLLIIDVIRKGRQFFWIWLLVFLPGIGGIVYIIMEVVPEYKDKFRNRPKKTNIRDIENLLKHQDTISNKILLADMYVENERYEEAINLYTECLEGPYRTDKDILFKRCKALYLKEDLAEAKKQIKALKKLTTFSDEHKLFEILINEDYDKLEEMFYEDVKFEHGYYCVKHFVKSGERERAQKIIAEMKESISYYKISKKTSSMDFYKAALRCMR